MQQRRVILDLMDLIAMTDLVAITFAGDNDVRQEIEFEIEEIEDAAALGISASANDV